jgi:hypothetical protein
MRKIIIFICLIFAVTAGIAQDDQFRRWSIGVNGGFCNHRTFTIDGFVQYNEVWGGYKVETKMGLNYHRFEASFQTIDGLDTKSIGLFAEAIIFPFRNCFFVGVRWDLITFNQFTDKALKKLESSFSTNALSGVFSGTNFYGIAGIAIPASKRINFRIYAMPGIQQYRVFNSTGRTLQSNHIDFVYQVNAGIVIQL